MWRPQRPAPQHRPLSPSHRPTRPVRWTASETPEPTTATRLSARAADADFVANCRPVAPAVIRRALPLDGRRPGAAVHWTAGLERRDLVVGESMRLGSRRCSVQAGHSHRSSTRSTVAARLSKLVRNVKAAGVGPRMRSSSRRCSASSTVGRWPAGTHHSTMCRSRRWNHSRRPAHHLQVLWVAVDKGPQCVEALPDGHVDDQPRVLAEPPDRSGVAI